MGSPSGSFPHTGLSGDETPPLSFRQIAHMFNIYVRFLSRFLTSAPGPLGVSASW